MASPFFKIQPQQQHMLSIEAVTVHLMPKIIVPEQVHSRKTINK